MHQYRSQFLALSRTVWTDEDGRGRAAGDFRFRIGGATPRCTFPGVATRSRRQIQTVSERWEYARQTQTTNYPPERLQSAQGSKQIKRNMAVTRYVSAKCPTIWVKQLSFCIRRVYLHGKSAAGPGGRTNHR